jgi:hypothetical protein
MNQQDVLVLSKLVDKVVVACMGQLTSFIVAKEMTPEEAAVLAWKIALVFREETAKLMKNGI